MIERFSEDVDIAVNWRPLGFTGARSPTSEMSRSRRTRLLSEMIQACRGFIGGEFRETLALRFSKILDAGWSLEVDAQNPDALNFCYPPAGAPSDPYVNPQVVLELGTHAELVPSADYTVTPYANEHFPAVFSRPSCRVVAIKAERTFWEKVTILHAEHHRPHEKPTPLRYSRHYYDVAMMAATPIKSDALGDASLLDRVVRHKQRFYPAAWARYDLARRGTMRLVPSDRRVADLASDYRSMHAMFFGARLEFDEVIQRIAMLEAEINDS